VLEVLEKEAREAKKGCGPIPRFPTIWGRRKQPKAKWNYWNV